MKQEDYSYVLSSMRLRILFAKRCVDKDCEFGGKPQPVENFDLAFVGDGTRARRCKICSTRIVMNGLGLDSHSDSYKWQRTGNGRGILTN